MDKLIIDRKQIFNIKKTKDRFFVYMLMKENNIVYIGRTKNLKTRLEIQDRSNKDFNKIVITENINQFQNIEKEKRYIKYFKPIYNHFYLKNQGQISYKG
jgi:predicted GIY-YIG superfamily endonuclease